MTYFEYQQAVFASDLSSTARLVALAIASHYNWKKREPAFIGLKALAVETGLAPRTITKARKELTETGYMTIVNRFNSTSLQTPTIPDGAAIAAVGESGAKVQVPDAIGGAPVAIDEAQDVLLIENLIDTLIENSIENLDREESTVADAPVVLEDDLPEDQPQRTYSLLDPGERALAQPPVTPLDDDPRADAARRLEQARQSFAEEHWSNLAGVEW